MITVIVLLLTVALGCFISYFGDLQGRRWGKRRVSIWGLRPKHTAILITSVTGGVVAFLSIGTMMAISPGVRNVILRGERAIDENANLIKVQRSEQRRTAAQIREAREQQDATLGENRRLAADQKALQQRVAPLQHNVAALQTQYDRLRRNQEHLIAQFDQKLRQIASLKKRELELTLAIRADKDYERKSSGINRSLGEKNVSLERENDQLQSGNTNLADVNRLWRAENDKLRADTTRLKDDQAQLETTVRDLRVKVGELDGIRAAYEKDSSAQNSEYRELNEKKDELLTVAVDSQQSFMTMRSGAIVIRAREMLGRCVVDSHSRPERVLRDLNDLLDKASARVVVRGAGNSDHGRSVRLFSKHVVTDVAMEDAAEDASLHELQEKLSGSDSPWVVTVNAVYNSIAGEQPVWVDLTPIEVKTVFHAGDVVAAQSVDARQPFDRILDSIAQFLQKDVHDAATKAGAVPQIDSETGAPTLGRIGPADLLPLVDRVRRMRGDVLLTAVARQTMTNADSLQLDFKLSRPRVR